MPRNNNDAYLLNFVGKFLEGYATGKSRDMDYKEKLALKELETKAKAEKDAADAKQQDFENALRLNTARADADKAGRETQYVDEKGQVHKTMPLATDQVSAMRGRIDKAAEARGYGAPAPSNALPPLPVPTAATVSLPPLAAGPAPQQLPTLPNQGPLAAPNIPPIPEVTPAGIKKFPTFDDGSDRAGAEARRTLAQLSKRYEDAAKPTDESFKAYGDARGAYSRAQLAKSKGESASVADKDLILAMISARQGSRISDADVRLAMQQGSLDQQAANWYSLAVQGRLTDDIRDQIFKLTRDAAVSRDKEYTKNVEGYFTAEAQRLLPGSPTTAVVRPIRPIDWDKVMADYDAEYNAPSKGGGWDQKQESELRDIERELAEIEKSKKKKPSNGR